MEKYKYPPMDKMLPFDEWLDQNEDELYITLVETGCTTEPEFDLENAQLKYYEDCVQMHKRLWVRGFCKYNNLDYDDKENINKAEVEYVKYFNEEVGS